MHKSLTRDEFVAVLEDITECVRAGDSWEGHIEWVFPFADSDDPDSFDVRGVWRVGNLLGQGGVRTVGEPDESPAGGATDE